MPNLGFSEIMILLVVAVVVFGPRKLPELGRSLGQGIREFRRNTQGLKNELGGAVDATAHGRPLPVAQAAVSRSAGSPVPAPTPEPLQRD